MMFAVFLVLKGVIMMVRDNFNENTELDPFWLAAVKAYRHGTFDLANVDGKTKETIEHLAVSWF